MNKNFSAEIEKILNLAPEGPRPFDRLERGVPVAGGKEAVAQFPLKDLGIGGDQGMFLQGCLYAYFDCFEEAHFIADHEGIAGNWLHAIVHRREPDPSNSKYWYARVKLPPEVSRGIASEVRPFIEAVVGGGGPPRPPKKSTTPPREPIEWDPMLFVDLCGKFGAKVPSDPGYQALAKVQQIEWNALLKYILA